ncbi:MAG: hypothetical protein KAQ95_09060 [Candidatus Heimdallarchaeota archaeon]|nr:hypothetical protein [Candidatus Heimdallarchaeota archaeon]
MKKLMKIGLPFLLVIVMLAPTMAKADYNVAVGNSFTYDVVKASWDLSYATDASAGTGFQFEEANYPVNTQFTVAVTAASASAVSWDMTVGSATDSGSNGGLDLLGMLLYMFYPLLLGEIPSVWNQTAADLGPSIFPLFFIDAPAFSEFFYQMSNGSYVSTALSDPEWSITNMGGTFDNATAIAVFEWHLDLTFTDAVSGHNYGGTYSLIFAFDKTTGVMKGYSMNINYSGQMDFTAVSIKYEQRVEQVGYNLPGVGFIPGFEWFLVIPAFAVLIGLPIIAKRRK